MDKVICIRVENKSYMQSTETEFLDEGNEARGREEYLCKIFVNVNQHRESVNDYPSNQATV